VTASHVERLYLITLFVSITCPSYKRKTPPRILYIRNILQYLLHFHNCKINFIWVSGPSGIPGNELVDQLAKSASISFHTPTSSPTSSTPSPTHGSINFRKILVVTPFTPEYNPSLPTKPWFSDVPQFSRKTIVTSCRLRFGHNAFRRHYQGSFPPSPLTVHFIPKLTPWQP